MANSQAVSVQFKKDILANVLDGHAIKAALYLTTASIDGSTTVYTVTGEVSGTGYTAGGVAITNGTTATSGTTSYWTPGAAITYTGVTLATAFNCVLLYDTTNANHAICALTFGSQTVTAADFIINMPTNDSANALIRMN